MEKEVIELSSPVSSDGQEITELEASLEADLGPLVEPSARLAGKHGLAYGVRRENLPEVMSLLRDGKSFLFSLLVDITAVDWFDRRETRFEVVYQLLSLTYLHRLCIKVSVPEEDPVVRSVTSLWPAAIFLEREVWDMFGIRFEGHPDLRRILMYDEFLGHPLRKDYPIRRKQPRVPLRVPELRNTSADMQRSELSDE